MSAFQAQGTACAKHLAAQPDVLKLLLCPQFSLVGFGSVSGQGEAQSVPGPSRPPLRRLARTFQPGL